MAEPSDIFIGTEEAPMGTKVLISFQRNSPGVTHTLTVEIRGRELERHENLAASFLWQIPDYTVHCESSASVLCDLFCRTYQEGRYLGSSHASLLLTNPEPVKILTDHIVLGENNRITMTERAANFRLDLALVVNGIVYSMGEKLTSQAHLWLAPYEIAREFPTEKKREVILRCTSWNGSFQVGRTEVPAMAEIPENDQTRPQIVSVTLKPLAQGLQSPFADMYIRSKTGLYGQVAARSAFSRMDRVILRAGDRQVDREPLKIPLLDSSGQVQVTVTAVDQRGFTARRTESIYVWPYERPRVIPVLGTEEVICQRADSSGGLTPEGTFLAIRAGRRVSPLGNSNRGLLRYRWKQTEDPGFSAWETLLSPGDSRQELTALLGGLVSDPQKSYQVELSCLDTLGEEHRLSFPVMTRAISFVLYDGVDGAAFGKFPEQPHVVDLASHMTLKVRGKLEVLGETWQDLGLSVSVQPSAVPHGRWEDTGCFYRVCSGNRVCISLNCASRNRGYAIPLSFELLPEALRPRRPVTALCPCEGGTARISVNPSGEVTLEGLTGTDFAGWIDGYLEYFI